MEDLCTCGWIFTYSSMVFARGAVAVDDTGSTLEAAVRRTNLDIPSIELTLPDGDTT